MKAELFPGANSYKRRTMPIFPYLAELSMDVQERVLLDEVIGAMMGQEGLWEKSYLRPKGLRSTIGRYYLFLL